MQSSILSATSLFYILLSGYIIPKFSADYFTNPSTVVYTPDIGLASISN